MRISDLRGLARLATRAAAGVTRIAEGVHQAVWSTLGFRGGPEPGRARGLTGLVYRSVHDSTLLVGGRVDKALTRLERALDKAGPRETPRRETLLAILNGVLGDRLEANANPLAIPMTLRYQGEPLEGQVVPNATGKVALLIHGLCMSDGHWQPSGQALDHGSALEALGYTPVYLRYNSGLHISQNGLDLSALLERFVADWPAPIADLTVVAHSMGGLLTRSALYYAEREVLTWPNYLKHLVFLGTPHHGSPVERAGNGVDVFLGRTPFTAPFAALGQMRSAGITDLRYGTLLDEDWQDRDRFHRAPDTRTSIPLPNDVACYTVAATKAGLRSTLANRLLGDGLVPVPSALGQHDAAEHHLSFAPSAQWITYRTSHLELLSNPDVIRQVGRWLS